MSAVVWQAVMILFSQVLLDGSVQGCSPGWFGSLCDYQCNCNVSTSCGSRGECPPNERCKHGFFGPGCQYVDLVAWMTGASIPPYLFDNDVTSCNPDNQATSVFYALTHGTPVSWFRIYSRNNPRQYTFSVKINGFGPYPDERQYLVNEHEVDVMWGQVYEIKDITIDGNIAPTICRIQMTTGRNVALKQFTNQSSVFNGSQGQASNAVDGVTSDKISGNSCVITREEAPAKWSLYFKRPQLVSMAYVYNSEHRAKTAGFNFRTIGPQGNVIVNYTDQTGYRIMTYYVLLKPFRPVIRIEMRSKQAHPNEYSSLEFCELQVFGDNDCSGNTHGLDCEQSCLCGNNHPCSSVTGLCATRCPSNKYGPTCSSGCSTYCHQAICHERTGACFQCHQGFRGPQCDLPCIPGTYGSGCTQECSHNCAHFCDTASGYCGECAKGYYGEQCENLCPAGCHQQLCHRDTGECLVCAPGHTGRYCTACPAGTYGRMCHLKCSPQCVNKTCSSITGRCLNCTLGYTGSHCRTATTVTAAPDNYVMWMVVLVILFAVIVPLLLIFCLEPVKVLKPDGEEEVKQSLPVGEVADNYQPVARSKVRGH